ncbi:protein sidekick-2-like isoform X3 [Convolutriloba macropyga]|uniref:protein sidekick-2-like isoform X3 n=1 Tax=Convolutriloba macropyga TaxID=536237 RepID=UPI003F520FA3
MRFEIVSGVTLVFCYSTVLLLPLLLTTSIGTTAAIEEDDSQGGREGTTWPVSFSLANFATSKYNRPPIVIAPPLSDKDDQEGADDSAVNYVKADCFANGDPSPNVFKLYVENKFHFSSTEYQFYSPQPTLSLLPVRPIEPLDKAGLYRAQCEAEQNDIGKVISSSFFIQVLGIDWSEANTEQVVGTEGTILNCLDDDFQDEITQSNSISSDLRDRLKWYDAEGKNLLDTIRDDNLSYVITHQREIVLTVAIEEPTSISCGLDGVVIKTYQLTVEDSTDSDATDLNGFWLEPRDEIAVDKFTSFVQFDCIGPKGCKPSWFFNDVQIDEGEGSDGPSYHLRVDKPDVSHQGTYSCGCWEDAGTNNGDIMPQSIRSARLTLLPAVQELDVMQKEYRVRLFDEIEIPCSLQTPLDTLTSGSVSAEQMAEWEQLYSFGWYRNGNKIKQPPLSDEISVTTSTPNQTIQLLVNERTKALLVSPNFLDTTVIDGIYQCFAESSNPVLPVVVSEPVVVKVDYEPIKVSLSMDSKYKPVIESHFVELNCTVEGGSKEQTIAWYHNDVVIDKEDIRYSTKEVEMDNVRLNLLQIKSVEVDRTGDYKCRVVEKVHYNDPPNSIESDPLELKIIRRTALIQGVSNSWAARLSSTTMHCLFRIDESLYVSQFDYGTDELSYQLMWKFWPAAFEAETGEPFIFTMDSFDDTLVTVSLQPVDENDVKVSEGLLSGTKIINSSIAIANIDEDRAGIYKCIVNTTAGSESSAGNFSVFSAPNAPVTIDVMLIPSSGVLLTWMEESDGNNPISHVTIRYWKTKAQGLTVPDDDRQYEMYVARYSSKPSIMLPASFVKPWSTYIFQVRLNNSIGNGRYSPESEPFEIPEASPDRPPENVKSSALNSTAIEVTFSPISSEHANGRILGYDIQYVYTSAKQNTKQYAIRNPYQYSAVITKLSVYEMIELTVTGKTIAGKSPPSEKVMVRTKEDRPKRNIKLAYNSADVTSTSIKVIWSGIPSRYWMGPQKYYLINVSCIANCTVPEQRQFQVEPQHNSFTIRNLKPFNVYLITGSLSNGLYEPKNPSNELKITTDESTPGKVCQIRLFDVTDQSVRLVWSMPKEPNGVITGYSIELYNLKVGSSFEEGMKLNDPKISQFISNYTTSSDQEQIFIKKLNQSSQYVANIRAMTKIGKGLDSVFSFSSSVPPMLPDPPNNVHVINVTARSASLQYSHGFSGHTSINRWIVEVKKLTRSSWKHAMTFEILDKPELSLIQLEDNFLVPFTRYSARIVACNIVGCSRPSATSVVFQTQPDIPRIGTPNVVANAVSADKIEVFWNPLSPSDWNDKVANCHYVVQYSSDNEAIQSISVDITHNSTVLRQLTPYVSYTISVDAKNSQGSQLSVKQKVSTYEAAPCALPSGSIWEPAGDSGKNALTISWLASSNPCARGQIKHYVAQILYNRQVVQNFKVDFDQQMSATFVDLRSNLTYYARVAAVNGAGMGQWSHQLKRHIDPSVPQEPSDIWIRINPGFDSCSVDVFGLVTKEDFVDQVHFQYTYTDSAESNTKSSSQEASKFTDFEAKWFHRNLESCEEDSQIKIGISFSNSMGTGPMKEFVTKYRPNYQFPNDAIQNIQATSRTRDAFFSWAVKDPVYIQNYTLEISHVTNMAVNDIPELGFSTHIPEATIAGLRPNQNYQITIYANGYSGARASSRVSIRTESDLPDGAPVLPTYAVKGHRVQIEDLYIPQKYLNGELKKYELQYRLSGSKDDDSDWNSLSSTSTSMKTEPLTPEQTYEMRVAAHNKEKGAGPWSNLFYVFIKEDGVMGSPRNVHAVDGRKGASFMSVEWEKPNPKAEGLFTDAVQSISGYQVCYEKHPSETECVTLSEGEGNTTMTIENLEGYSQYRITVRAFNHQGYGNFSEPILVKTDIGVPSAVSLLSVDALSDSLVQIKWSSPSKPQGPILDYLIAYKQTTGSNAASGGDSKRVARSAHEQQHSVQLVDETSLYGSSLLVSSFLDKFDEHTNFLVLNDLPAGKNYQFSVRAITEEGLGDEVVKEVLMGRDPSLPASPSKPKIREWVTREGGRSGEPKKQLEISWRPPDFENEAEPVINYAVYLLYSGRFKTEATIVGKTLTIECKLELTVNETGKPILDYVLSNTEEFYRVDFAVAAINRNGQGLLGIGTPYYAGMVEGTDVKVAASVAWYGQPLIPVICLAVIIILTLLCLALCVRLMTNKHGSKGRNNQVKGRDHDAAVQLLMDALASGSSHYDSNDALSYIGGAEKDTMLHGAHEVPQIQDYLQPGSEMNRSSIASASVVQLSHPSSNTAISTIYNSAHALDMAPSRNNVGSLSRPARSSTSQTFQNSLAQQRPISPGEFGPGVNKHRSMELGMGGTGGYVGGSVEPVAGGYRRPDGTIVCDPHEERHEGDSDSANSSSHQPDASEEIPQSYPHSISNRFPGSFSPANPEPLPMESPSAIGSEMGTFGRSAQKRNQQLQISHPTTTANLNPNALSQTRVPLHSNSNNNINAINSGPPSLYNGISNGSPDMYYPPPTGLPGAPIAKHTNQKPMIYSSAVRMNKLGNDPMGPNTGATIDFGHADRARVAAASQMPLSSFRASLEEDEDSV